MTNHTIWVIPTSTCVKEQSWSVKLEEQHIGDEAQIVDTMLGKFAMVNVCESLEGSLTLKDENCADTSCVMHEGGLRICHLSQSNGQQSLRAISGTYSERNVLSDEPGKPYGFLQNAGKQLARVANAQRVEEWAKSESRPVIGRIDTMYRSERRQTCPWSNIAGKV